MCIVQRSVCCVVLRRDVLNCAELCCIGCAELCCAVMCSIVMCCIVLCYVGGHCCLMAR